MSTSIDLLKKRCLRRSKVQLIPGGVSPLEDQGTESGTRHKLSVLNHGIGPSSETNWRETASGFNVS